ncbi:MAG: hypothetical protein RIS26_392 [Actinomycetota bacterium]|jgi:hypothetical protein
MLVCANCNEPPASPTDVFCGGCGQTIKLVERPVTGTIRHQKSGIPTWLVIAGGSLVALILAVVVILAFVRPGTQSQQPGGITKTDTPTPTPEAGAAQTISNELIDGGICTAAWSVDEYAESPTAGIPSSYWDDGSLRTCKVDRTADSPTRWVTILTGAEILSTYGDGWIVPAGTVAIFNPDKTILLNENRTKVDIKDDAVVQAILVKYGGKVVVGK